MAIQDKTVKYTTTSKTAITLVENTIDNTTTSLVFPYQDYVNINRIVNNNLIHLVENFCSNTAPAPAIEGQLWLDTSDPDNKQELGRLKIYMYQTAGLQFVDVGGTVMDKFGNLRHTGHIEAFNDLNNIPENENEFPDDPDYYKFLTTKAHCDSNYLSGYYSTDNTEFFIRGNRPVTYTKELIYGAPFKPKDSRTLVQKKFADMYYLFGKTNLATAFNITNDKKIYYDNSIEMTQDFQLITKTKCDDKFAETIATVINSASNIKTIADKIKKIAYDPLNSSDLENSGAIAIANEVKRLVSARPKPQTSAPATLCGNTGTITIIPTSPTGTGTFNLVEVGSLSAATTVPWGTTLTVGGNYSDPKGFYGVTVTFQVDGISVTGATDLPFTSNMPAWAPSANEVGKKITAGIKYFNDVNDPTTQYAVATANSVTVS